MPEKCEACNRDVPEGEGVTDAGGAVLCPACAKDEPRYLGIGIYCSGCGRTQLGAVALAPGQSNPPAWVASRPCPSCRSTRGIVHTCAYTTDLQLFEPPTDKPQPPPNETFREDVGPDTARPCEPPRSCRTCAGGSGSRCVEKFADGAEACRNAGHRDWHPGPGIHRPPAGMRDECRECPDLGRLRDKVKALEEEKASLLADLGDAERDDERDRRPVYRATVTREIGRRKVTRTAEASSISEAAHLLAQLQGGHAAAPAEAPAPEKAVEERDEAVGILRTVLTERCLYEHLEQDTVVAPRRCRVCGFMSVGDRTVHGGGCPVAKAEQLVAAARAGATGQAPEKEARRASS